MKVRAFFRRWWPIGIILLAGAVWWPAFNYLVDFRNPDVPFVTTPHDVVTAMLDLAEVSADDTVYDLGSGDGRIVIAAARRGARAVGIEIDPELAEQASEAIRDAGLADRAKIRRGDLFKQDLSPATVVTLYLMPNINVQLRPQLEKLRPGCRIVSHWFSMPGARPVKKIKVRSSEDKIDHDIYLWVTPIEWE
jgi:protein-L-isoaspartate O-methyltransferase